MHEKLQPSCFCQVDLIHDLLYPENRGKVTKLILLHFHNKEKSHTTFPDFFNERIGIILKLKFKDYRQPWTIFLDHTVMVHSKIMITISFYCLT